MGGARYGGPRRDAALAKAQEEVCRLNSTNQQLSVTSADSAERLAAVTADRDTRLKAAQTMYTVQKEKTARVAKERDYYKTELDTLRALVATEQEASAAEKRALIERYEAELHTCLLYTSPSPRDRTRSRMPSSA